MGLKARGVDESRDKSTQPRFFGKRNASEEIDKQTIKKRETDINGRVLCNGIDCGVCSICSAVYVIRTHNTFYKSIHIHILK